MSAQTLHASLSLVSSDSLLTTDSSGSLQTQRCDNHVRTLRMQSNDRNYGDVVPLTAAPLAPAAPTGPEGPPGPCGEEKSKQE